MREQHSPIVKKIQCFSSVAMVFLGLLLLLSLIFTILFPFMVATSPTLEQSLLAELIVNNDGFMVSFEALESGVFTVTEKWWFGLWVVVFFTVCSVGLYMLLKLFDNFRQGTIFANSSVWYARRFAYIALALLVLTIALELVSIGISGDLNLSIPDDLNKYLLVITIWIFVWILEIGTELNADDELTV